MRLPPVTNALAGDLTLAARGDGPDPVSELAPIGFGPGVVAGTIEINEDAISAPAAR